MIKIRALVEKHWDMVSYLFFGVLTTVVNYLVYLPLYNLAGISAAVSNMIAWVAAVAFAYHVTNKPFVFKSHDWSMQTVCPGWANSWAAGQHPAVWKRRWSS